MRRSIFWEIARGFVSGSLFANALAHVACNRTSSESPLGGFADKIDGMSDNALGIEEVRGGHCF